MSAGIITAYSKPLVLVTSSTAPAANATRTYVTIWPARGWGTLRLHVCSTGAMTINFLQRPTGSFTMRQTDTQAVAASTGTPIEFLITSDFIRLDGVEALGATIATFELQATLYP